MNGRLLILVTMTVAVAVAVVGAHGRDVQLDRNGVEFFETHVRPLLVKRCYECHSAESDPVEGGLRLDSRAAWQRGGDSGAAIIPGMPSKSRVMQAVLYQDPTLAMPPDSALPVREIEVLRKWIELGAQDPRDDEPHGLVREVNLEEGRRFWSFQPIRELETPEVLKTGWSNNAVDRFVLRRLDEHELRPVRRASRRTLIRRASFDVLGLPPTSAEVDEFVNDPQPDAWSRLVDRLLASPHFGERWGRHWLDVARYADDQLREEYYYRQLPHAWRYRDWVVQSLNEDLPYDQFVKLQIAGDLFVEEFGYEATAATGFLSLGMIYQDDGRTPEGIAVAAAETLDDRVDTVTRGLLGLTVSCARCHDHKFDPIPTEDYYSLAGIFENTKYVESAPLVPPEIVDRAAKLRKEIQGTKVALAAGKDKDPRLFESLRQKLEELQQREVPAIPLAHAVLERGNKDMHVALRGNRLKPGPLVPRRFLRVLAGDDPPRFTGGSGRRELAEAIVSANNSLTARVVVNRIWQHYFGRGIVASASNFGQLGERPTHPDLLDWLASQLIKSAWSLKQVHREILLSATYQLSTDHDRNNNQRDAGNQWLWRTSRRRLDIEAWRDSLLFVSGELDNRLNGPAESDLLTSRRRTIYGAVRRDNQTESDKLVRLFDFPNPRHSSAGRASTTTAQQQLFSLNNPFVVRLAEALARRFEFELMENGRDQAVRAVFRTVFARNPSDRELSLAASFIGHDSPSQRSKLTLWEQYCQVLLISNELMHRP